MSAKEIFQDALDVPPADRDTWVRVKCGDDRALLIRVKGLLDAYLEATRLDRGPAAAALSAFAGSKPPASASPLEELGTVINDRYELLSVLGEGGFGVVYLARQTTPVVRDVALKILRTGLDSHQIVARFEAERQTLALMDHPGIAHVYDAGETANGRPFIAMEFVDGEPITKFCEKHTLGLDARLRLIEQVCMAIQHAHTKGIIHRDLKPTNILVTELDGEPFPTVIDFGIAKVVDPDASALVADGVQLTQEFQIIGTPQYMSPEQATRGGGGGIDTRSDVYSIGTVLYELIAGVPPFDPTELRMAGLEGVLRVIRERTPARPSTRLLSGGKTSESIATTKTFGEAPSRLSRRVSGDVDWIVMRSLEKEPSRRYQSAADFAADIRRHLAHEPVMAGPPSWRYQAQKFVRRHRVSVAAAAVVAVALIATAAISAAAAKRAREAERIAIANAQRATDAEHVARESEALAIRNEQAAQRELKKAHAVVGFTQSLLSGVAPAVARGRDTAILREVLEEAARSSPAALKEEPMIELILRNLIATVWSELGDYQAAYDLVWPAWQATANVTERDDRLARVVSGPLIGELLGELGRLDEADTFLRDLLAEIEKLGLGETDEAIDTLCAISNNCISLNDFAEAKRVAERAIALSSKSSDWEKLEMSRDRMANAQFFLGEYEDAIKNFDANLAVTIEHKGIDAPEVSSIRTSLGAAHKQLGHLKEAEEHLRAALDASRKLYEPGNPRLVMSMSVYGDMLESAERFEEAAKILEEAKSMAALKFTDDNAITVTINGRLVKALLGMKRWDEAIALNRELIKTIQNSTPEDVATIATLVASMMQAELGADRPRNALSSLAEFTPKAGWSEEVQPFFRATLEISSGQAYLRLGELDAARDASKRAGEWFEKEGRSSGRYFRRLTQLNVDIAAATSRPTTMPTTNPTSAPAAP